MRFVDGEVMSSAMVSMRGASLGPRPGPVQTTSQGILFGQERNEERGLLSHRPLRCHATGPGPFLPDELSMAPAQRVWLRQGRYAFLVVRR